MSTAGWPYPDAMETRDRVETLAGFPEEEQPTSPAFADGKILDGKYVVEGTIARGGIGVVVAANHEALHQRVAIKYLRPAVRRMPDIVERFVREARLAATIKSEHVVRVHDVGKLADAGPYMVMEHLVGTDLGEVVKKGPLPVARAVDYLLQACDALAEAHVLGIVHRDIKPENLFLAERHANTPIVKIIDFGISKVAPKRGRKADWARQTGENECFGTPLYMSPEQLQASTRVDERSDIWALGVVLHELLTGSPPFNGDDYPGLCAAIIAHPAKRLRELRPGAPEALEAVILKCLEKEPARRYRNVAELAQELGPFGPAAATARVERIKAVIRHAGESIRPPMPSQGEFDLPMQAPVVVAPLPAFVSGGPTSGVRRPVLVVLGALLVTALVGAALLRTAHRSPAPTPATSAPVAVTSPPIASTPPSPAAPAAPSAAEATPSSDDAPPQQPTPTPRPAATGKPPARPAGPLPAPTDRRSRFGERE
jgi:serine/threonine protein kinase